MTELKSKIVKLFFAHFPILRNLKLAFAPPYRGTSRICRCGPQVHLLRLQFPNVLKSARPHHDLHLWHLSGPCLRYQLHYQPKNLLRFWYWPLALDCCPSETTEWIIISNTNFTAWTPFLPKMSADLTGSAWNDLFQVTGNWKETDETPFFLCSNWQRTNAV